MPDSFSCLQIDPWCRMKTFCRHLTILPLAALVAFLSTDGATVLAQGKKGPAPIAASPQAPTITFPSPSGAQRGTSVEVELNGTNLGDPIDLWSSFPSKASFPTDLKGGKIATKLRVKLEVPNDAPIGFHTIRLVTKWGVSNSQTFCIDDLPQVAEVAGNQTKLLAQVVPFPCVVMGKTDVETSDFFKINVKEGERVTLEALGRRLGSALDTIILVYDGRTGREYPGLYSDDAPGLQSDARLSFIAKKGGEYFVEIRDTTHRGGPDYHYRLRMGNFPAALTAFPVAAKRGSKTTIGFSGADAVDAPPIEMNASLFPKTVEYLAPKRSNGQSGWPVPVQLTDMEERVETEPNDEMSKANKITIPCGVTARFQEKGDIDYFSFDAKKGLKYRIAAETFEINSPAEVYLILKNAKGVDLAKSVPAAPSANIEYSATEDSTLFIHAEHTNYVHGPNEVYHLIVKQAEPDFDVNFGIDRCEAAPGGTTLLPITGVIRRDYAGPIELSVGGHPGLSGTIIIPPSVGGAAPKDNATVLAYLPIKVDPGIQIGAYAFHVRAKGAANGTEIIRLVNVADVVKRSMADLAFPPRETLTSLAIGVTDKPPYDLSAKAPVLEVSSGASANVALLAARIKGVSEEIALSALNLPPKVTAVVKPIAKGSNETQIQVTVASGATAGPATFYLRASSKVGERDFVTYVPIALLIKAESKKEPEKEKPKEKK